MFTVISLQIKVHGSSVHLNLAILLIRRRWEVSNVKNIEKIKAIIYILWVRNIHMSWVLKQSYNQRKFTEYEIGAFERFHILYIS